ncbi:LCP family protein, partial [Shewanella sp. C31]|nr:LCP family protein [Shewanella electrica]
NEALRPERVGPLPEVAVVVAARDIDYCGYHTPCGPGSRTDTIFYVRLAGQEVRGLAVPRDLYSPLAGGKINAAYGRGGAELLKRAVEEATGLVVERHLILTLESVARVVDAVGGGRSTWKGPCATPTGRPGSSSTSPRGTCT